MIDDRHWRGGDDESKGTQSRCIREVVSRWLVSNSSDMRIHIHPILSYPILPLSYSIFIIPPYVYTNCIQVYNVRSYCSV